MKLYLTTAGYHGTQAEAKAFSKDYEQVEVPTDKPGLIEFLNRLHNERSDREDQYTTVVERHDPPVETGPSNTDQLVAFEDQWEQFPLARELHFAALACEDAREAIKPAKSQPTPALTIAEIDDVDELLS